MKTLWKLPKVQLSCIQTFLFECDYLKIKSIECNSVVVHIKGIVHFEIKIWYLSAYPKGIQDVGVFFSSVDPILMFLGQTV